MAAQLALLPVVIDLRRHERDPTQHHRRARTGASAVMTTGRGPLQGLRVIALGTRIAAPFCAGLLGEMGADVIKIEQPGTGDFMREIGPFAASKDGSGCLPQ